MAVLFLEAGGMHWDVFLEAGGMHWDVFAPACPNDKIDSYMPVVRLYTAEMCLYHLLPVSAVLSAAGHAGGRWGGAILNQARVETLFDSAF